MNSPSLALPGPHYGALQPVLNVHTLKPMGAGLRLRISTRNYTLHKQWTISTAPALASTVLYLPRGGLTLRCCVPSNHHCVAIATRLQLKSAIRLLPCEEEAPTPQPLLARSGLLAFVRHSSALMWRLCLSYSVGRIRVGVVPGVHLPCPAAVAPPFSLSGTAGHIQHAAVVISASTAEAVVGFAHVLVKDWNTTGCVVCISNAANTLDSWSVHNCSTTVDTLGTSSALFLQNATVALRSCSFSGNVVFEGSGGAVRAEGNSTLRMNAVSLRGNRAPAGCGGAVFMGQLQATATLHLDQQTIFDGNSGLRGGAVCMTPHTGVLSAAQTTWRHNTATEGGAIFAVGTAEMSVLSSACHFSANQAVRGGSIWCSGCIIALRSTGLHDHTARQGGAVYAQFSTMRWTDCTAHSNTAWQGG